MRGKKQTTELGWFHTVIHYAWLPLSILFQLRLIVRIVMVASLPEYADRIDNWLLTGVIAGYFIAPIGIPLMVFLGLFRKKKYAWILLEIFSVGNAAAVIYGLFFLRFTSLYQYLVLLAVLSVTIAILIYYWRHRTAFGIGIPAAAEATSRLCSACGELLSAGAHFCSHCGAKAEEEAAPKAAYAVPKPKADMTRRRFCYRCGAEMPPEYKFCTNCYARIDAVPLTMETKAPPAGSFHFCPDCGRLLKAESKFCYYCGGKVEKDPPKAPPGARVCPECGYEVASELRYCINCGTKVEDAAPPAD